AHDEDFVAADRRAAIGAGTALAQNAFMARLAVRPELAPGGRVERIHIIPAGHVHDAVLNDGRDLEQALIVRHRKHPGGADALHVGRVDELEWAVPISTE